jgi:alkylated DNA repair protein (DNA oxidative demethylase)
VTGLTADLFGPAPGTAGCEVLATDAMVLRGFALAQAPDLLAALDGMLTQSPWRRLSTPGGKPMAVDTSNCGSAGWISDRKGYRYSVTDPLNGQPWPALPASWLQLADAAAQTAGFGGVAPDACLVNRYAVGAGMGLHQDRDEQDFTAPIVSVSLGLPARFRFGGLQRSDPVRSVVLHHGDVVVWGGHARLAFHGITPLRAGEHPLTGQCRINLTFRKAL